MKLNKKKSQEQKGAPRWMTTYADMVTLILVFFVLLFSMSQINEVKFDAVAESFKNRMIFDFLPSPVESENPTQQTEVQESGEQSNEFEDPTEDPQTVAESEENESDGQNEEETAENQLNEVVQEVDEFLESNQLQDIISAERTERGVVLVLQEQLLFNSGEAEILESGRPFLGKLSDLLSNVPNHVKVEGHTDNRPISTEKFPSNWELSGARAGSVIRYLLNTNEQLEPVRFTATAYGATRPVAPNDSQENWKKNRRVEVVILDPEYESTEQAQPASS
ncbi:flagellar motor protein MotS [Salimicrobium halophilum]|uniref:Chemotaxis protein MotB n=1 Tax=Salimicrobium halophilum TaxID=86666 RepID=A0A1G8VLS2_9BACI|nr:flagellar motor protein MotS [Salimicrobium halophilum]SDJ66325.1 chemotaxis protein MotB [Salimicrobium halophilum]